ncbi:MAG: hypothetical protein K0Q73_6289, partial [Paenibacillus sp.]|nr:hypothetical protein [Paenibacillus sp.]
MESQKKEEGLSHSSRIRLFDQLPPRNAELIRRFQSAPHACTADRALQRTAVQIEHLAHLVRRLLQKLDPVGGYTQLPELRQIFRAGLLDRIVYRIAAAFVDSDRMGHADSVLQRNAVILARAPAVRVIRPFAQERAIDAMLGV